MIWPSHIQLSSKRHIPVLSVYRRTFYPHQFIHRMIAYRGWHLLQKDPPIVKIKGQILEMNPRYFDTLFGEWLSWKTVYLPEFSLNGRRVLDVGAGCGETALFFLSQGAKSVVCIEPDPENMELLRRNAERNRWNVEFVPSLFSPEMLSWKFDYMKMDCEGCETSLLRFDSLSSCTIEIHDSKTHNEFVEKFRVKTVAHERETWIVQSD